MNLENVNAIDLSLAKKVSNIIARGETSNHAHILTGDVDVLEMPNKDVFINVKSKASIKHLLETDYIVGREVWTKEHTDIELDKGLYKYIQQVDYDPYADAINSVKD